MMLQRTTVMSNTHKKNFTILPNFLIKKLDVYDLFVFTVISQRITHLLVDK